MTNLLKTIWNKADDFLYSIHINSRLDSNGHVRRYIPAYLLGSTALIAGATIGEGNQALAISGMGLIVWKIANLSYLGVKNLKKDRQKESKLTLKIEPTQN